MRYPILCCAAAVLVASVGCASLKGEGTEDKVQLGQTPPAVQAAIKKAVGEGKFEDVVKEMDDGKVVYEAEFEVGEVDHSVKVAEDGKVLEEESAVAFKDLPKVVTDAITAKHAKAEMKDAWSVKADGKTYYEVGIEVGEAYRELKIDPAGKILDDKVEADHEDKEDAQDEKN